jgi:hypothetical protein
MAKAMKTCQYARRLRGGASRAGSADAAPAGAGWYVVVAAPVSGCADETDGAASRASRASRAMRTMRMRRRSISAVCAGQAAGRSWAATRAASMQRLSQAQGTDYESSSVGDSVCSHRWTESISSG